MKLHLPLLPLLTIYATTKAPVRIEILPTTHRSIVHFHRSIDLYIPFFQHTPGEVGSTTTFSSSACIMPHLLSIENLTKVSTGRCAVLFKQWPFLTHLPKVHRPKPPCRTPCTPCRSHPSIELVRKHRPSIAGCFLHVERSGGKV